jgi:HEAT repeat protein
MAGWHVKDLVEQLQERSAARRTDASIALGELGDPDVIPDLLRVVGDQEESIWQVTFQGEPHNIQEHPRVAAYEAVKKIANHEHLLKALVHRKYPEVRAQAAWLLSDMVPRDDIRERVVVALRKALNDPEVPVKFQAMLSLGTLGSLKVDEARPFFKLNDNYVRFQTLGAVGKIPSDDASNFVLSIIKDDNEADVFRIQGIRLMGEREDRQAVPTLIDLLMDNNPNIREHSAIALGLLGAMNALTPLYQTLIDEDEMVRYSAGIALAFLGDTRTVPFLLKARRHSDKYLQPRAQEALDRLGAHALGEYVSAMRKMSLPYRSDAVQILGQLKDERVLLILIESLLDEEIYLDVRNALLNFGTLLTGPLVYVLESKAATPDFIEKSIRILLDLEAKESIPALIKLLKHKSADIRELSTRALGKFKAKKAMRALKALIAKKEKESDDVIAEALLALGCMGDKKVVPILVEHLDHLSSKVRGYSISALGELADVSSVETLIKRLEDPLQDNQPLIIQTLAKIGDKKAVPSLLTIVEEARVNTLAGTKGSFLGSYAVQALATLGEVKVIRLLLTEWEEELERGIRIIGADAVPHLEQALTTERNPRVRALAAEALGVVGNETSLGTLITALQDEEEMVQKAVSKSLQKIHSTPRALPSPA